MCDVPQYYCSIYGSKMKTENGTLVIAECEVLFTAAPFLCNLSNFKPVNVFCFVLWLQCLAHQVSLRPTHKLFWSCPKLAQYRSTTFQNLTWNIYCLFSGAQLLLIQQDTQQILSCVSHWVTLNWYICISVGLWKDFPWQEIVWTLQRLTLI